MEKFIDREEEMEFLNSEYNKKESSLVILYGRRRIGKTSLIKEFGKDKEMLYFLATEESETQNKMQLSTIIFEQMNLQSVDFSMKDWDSIFKLLISRKTKNKKIIVIDEFQYLGKINPAFPSIFQRIWDTILKDENVMVILCGSLINMMESQVLNYSSPLYGRRTGQIKLKQIPFKNYNEFFTKNLSEKSLIEKYAVTGGVPKYIESFTEGVNIYNEIEKNILNKQSYLYEEPYFLLQHEVSEVGSYFSIIKTIAAGNKKMGNIASCLSVNPTNLSKYIQTLINLDILEREVPITEENPEKSKKGRYNIKDNYISFWFQFIYPNKAFLEMGNNEFVIEKIRNHFIDNHVSFVYENVCKEKMLEYNVSGKLGFTFDKIGRWWNNNEEIDIVAMDSNGSDIIFGECKYTNKPMDVDVLFDLENKSKNVEWKNEYRKEKYILFSVNGYTKRLTELAENRDDVILT